MKIDLHVHTSTGSDGALPLEEIFAEAAKRGIGFLSITDHDASRHYINFWREHGLITTGGSDCHRKPLRLGTVAVPEPVAAQFGREGKG